MNFLSILAISVLLIILLLLLLELFRLEINSVYQKIRKEIRFIIYPEVAIKTPDQKEMISLAVNVWRVEKGLNNLKKSEKEADTRRIKSSVEAMRKFLKSNNVDFIDHTGERYNNGRNLEVYDVEEDASVKSPIIVKTIEPSVVSNGSVIKKGKVIIKK